MRVGAAGLLGHRRIFESRDPEATRVFMQAREFEIDLAPREAGAFDFAGNAAYLPNSIFRYMRYGAAVRVRVPAERKLDDYFIHLPVRGKSEIVSHAGSAVCASGQAVVSSPAGHLIRSERGSERISVSLKKSAMMGQLAALLGAPPVRPLEFSPRVDLACAEGRRFSRYVHLAIADLDDPASARNPILLGVYEQLIMTGLLLCQGNTYTDALCGREQAAAPRDVKRVIDYMQGHLDAPITLADLVAAAGVPGRTLLKHFKDHRGTSPMRYLRDARLGCARAELLRVEADVSVTRVAMTWGFQHLGRFAIEYRRLFGESPSETCKRSSGGREGARPLSPTFPR